MNRAVRTEYRKYADRISADIPGAVYPLSVIEGIQSGDIYEDGGDLLIWHRCGFAFVTEGCGTQMLDFAYELMTGSGDRRLVLLSDDTGVRTYFSGKSDIGIGTRLFFTYDAAGYKEPALPDGFTAEEINEDNIGRIRGRITPAFSWDNDEFLAKGKGYCVMHGNDAVSWAFSAAISGRELDIGVETSERYRGLGLAAAAASKLISYALSHGRHPVWACHSENAASRRTALKLGFVKCAECLTFGKLNSR